MTQPELSELLKEAWERYPRDPEAALVLFARVAKGAVGSAWAQAQLALSRHAFGHGEYREAAGRARQVLDAEPSRVGAGIRGVAGILYCGARELAGQPVDEALLLASIEEAVADAQLYDAASGLSQLGRFRLLRDDREAARAALERAVELFDQAGSMTGGPAALKRLAELDLREGKQEDARRHLDRGLARLESFPLGGRNVRNLEEKLRELRARLGGPSES